MNSNQLDPRQHPLEAIGAAIGAEEQTELQTRSSNFQGADEGPASVIAKVSGAQSGGKREDGSSDLPNNKGTPRPNPTYSKTVGGLPLVSDTFLLQKQQHFNRSKTLERVVHSCGAGAFGYFECTRDVTELTKANFLSSVGEKTPVFVRFSTATLGREFPDASRNPRGFAIKFYTKEGNYDIVGLNFPVFFCRDPIQGPDVIRSQSRNPSNFLLDHDALFDFLANNPEANHAGIMLFSDHGTPQGWRFSHGYGCHTFKWVNADGEFMYVKYHFIAKHGQKQFADSEAMQMCGEDPDYSKRDLWEAIEKGEDIEWMVHVQIMDPRQADPDTLGFDPFDATKIWPRSEFRMKELGRLVLNKNPENFHRDVEQAVFSPGSMVPGIEDSPDPLLQFRMFLYRDAQYHRVGTNLHQIPVNCPFMAKSYASPFDGPMHVDTDRAGSKQYPLNSFAHKFRPDTDEAPYEVNDNFVSRVSHYWHEGKKNDYDQVRDLWTRVMSDQEKKNTCYNTAKGLGRIKYLAQVYIISVDYAQGIYNLLDEPRFEFSKVKKLGETKFAEAADDWYKEPKFRDKPGSKLVGYPPEIAVYQP
ncbi:hypothetical protein FGSG_06596 [Fusarium graminearum PH-1]|nr:hypothetical protein FGSG_06596 [Fusarium graminearum PH-1]ESU12705.1 hypothetical protein FGSG_06596 [Fusarium graminearum PH-1]|eukprot:XP_011326212.1 hypothetical protein FGSG_06596 [Fusarium graminearum PH-1]